MQKFFKKTDWGKIYNKEQKPPIIPEKKKGVLDMVGGDANPYALLDNNFDRKTTMEAVYLYEQCEAESTKNRTDSNLDNRSVSEISFTYDRDAGNHLDLSIYRSEEGSEYLKDRSFQNTSFGSLHRIGTGSYSKAPNIISKDTVADSKKYIKEVPMEMIVEEDDKMSVLSVAPSKSKMQLPESMETTSSRCYSGMDSDV